MRFVSALWRALRYRLLLVRTTHAIDMPRNRRDPYLRSWRWGNDTHVGDWGGSDTLPLLITLSCVSAWARSRPAAGAEQQRSCFRQRMAMQTAATLSLNAGKSWRGPFSYLVSCAKSIKRAPGAGDDVPFGASQVLSSVCFKRGHERHGGKGEESSRWLARSHDHLYQLIADKRMI